MLISLLYVQLYCSCSGAQQVFTALHFEGGGGGGGRKKEEEEKRCRASLYLKMFNILCPLQSTKLILQVLSDSHSEIPTHIFLNFYSPIQEAEEMFLKAIQFKPNTASYHGNLGVLYHRWGKLEQAYQNYQRSLTLDPSSEVTAENFRKLGRTLNKKGMHR